MSDLEMTMGTVKNEEVPNKRMTMLIWGPSGVGKTTLACTAPGKKLLICFDFDGEDSVSWWDDVDVEVLSAVPNAFMEKNKSQNNPLGLADKMKNYDTIIVDSLTNVSFKALMLGVDTTKNATAERPGLQAYGVRNALVIQLVKNMLAFTSKYNKHCIFIAHEDAPQVDDNGVVQLITLSLGGKLADPVALDISEVWNMSSPGAGRSPRIMIRPARNKKPCKTRMFQTNGDVEFDWIFNADEPTEKGNMRIDDWFNQWVTGGRRKIPLPTRKK